MLTLIIATPERQVFKDEVDSVTLPTVTGEITILSHHMPVSTILKHGEMIIRKEGKTEPYAVSGGFIEIQPDKVVVLADTAEHIAEIDEARAQEAIDRAEKLQQEINRDNVEYGQLTAKLERDLNRLHIVRKYRHRGHQGITHEGIRKE